MVTEEQLKGRGGQKGEIGVVCLGTLISSR